MMVPFVFDGGEIAQGRVAVRTLVEPARPSGSWLDRFEPFGEDPLRARHDTTEETTGPQNQGVNRVWTPRRMQGVFRLGRGCGQALSCVRPRDAAVHTPRARMGSLRAGSKSALRARGAPIDAGFSGSVSLTVYPYP
jgi:hypothetical protein